MITNLSHVMTLANSIIGVSVLAMPFCFKQCGIVLSILMLLVSSTLSKLACHFLVKSAVMSRRRNFEFLAFHAFGRTGKILAELFIIGFLMGTCIAFFVVVGDLGPEIIGKMIDKTPEDIRTTLLVIIGVSIILPLGLLRNVDSLSSICTATIGFYLCLVLKVVTESMTHIFAMDWYEKVFYWRPSGILQCLPIFSMALFCQTQLFEIYEAIPNVSLERMNQVVDAALNICNIVYVCVGFFGYVAFCTLPFSGNILMSFEPSLSSDVIKIGFVLSVAFSFPLVIFPCRASLNSLLFRSAHLHETSSNYIPETRFKCLTFLIVVVSLITGILIPNIEFVLGLVGSTIGVIICLMFPAAFFISISSKNTNERLSAQAMLFVGIWIMILGTYANLYAMEESANIKLSVTPAMSSSQLNQVPIDLINDRNVQAAPLMPNVDKLPNIESAAFKSLGAESIHKDVIAKDDVRQEPPVPVERTVVTEKILSPVEKSDSHLIPPLSPAIQDIVEEIKKIDQNMKEIADEANDKHRIDKGMEVKVVIPLKTEEKIQEIEMKDKSNAAINKNENLINSDAIRKEESELAEDAKLAVASEDDEKREELKKTLEKYNMEQRQLLREQIEIINNLKQQKQEHEKEKKRKLADGIMKNQINRDNRDANIVGSVDLNKHNVNNKNIKTVTKEDNKIVNKSMHLEQNKFKNIESTKQELQANADPMNNGLPNVTKTVENQIIQKSRGPILNALTKQVPNVTKANDDVNHDNVNLPLNEKIVSTNVDLKHEETNLSNSNVNALKDNKDKVPVPIALVMSEKTRQNDLNEQSILSQKVDKKHAIQRDILENPERRKREIDRKPANEPVVMSADKVEFQNSEGDKIKSFMNDIVQANSEQECAKTEESPRIIIKEITDHAESLDVKEQMTTEALLIKTNSYLSDQSVVNANQLDERFKFNSDFDELNRRDLKPLDSKSGKKK